jgi:hypothetical protein
MNYRKGMMTSQYLNQINPNHKDVLSLMDNALFKGSDYVFGRNHKTKPIWLSLLVYKTNYIRLQYVWSERQMDTVQHYTYKQKALIMTWHAYSFQSNIYFTRANQSTEIL